MEQTILFFAGLVVVGTIMFIYTLVQTKHKKHNR